MEISQTAAPQLSPDGQWWWDGQQWTAVPVPQAMPLAPLPYYPPPPRGTDGLAITSFILSLLWAFGLGSLAAVVLGHVSRSKAKRELRPPSGLALAGLILGYLGLAFILLALAAAIPVFNQQRAKGQLAALKSDLRNAAVQEETYYTDNNSYTDLETLQSQGLTLSNGVNLTVVSATADGFCLAGTNAGQSYYYDSANGGLTPTAC